MKLYAFLNRAVNKSFSESDVLHGCNIGVGYANGYVAVPPEHPLHGEHYNEANEVIDIHGGLTFSESVEEIKADGWRNDTECLGFDNFDEIPKDYWVFGFDTMHSCDGPHLDRQWCINETNDLLKQLQELLTEFTMTYEKALEVLESCTDETMKAAAQIACKALRAEIGRSHRYASDLESAETDYVRDIAYDLDLEGEDADSFFGKVKADGFDLMDAFHDGAEWQREREHDGMTLEDFCHVKYMLEDILERNMERSEVVKITQELHTQAFNVGLFKSKKAVWHTLDEKADLSKFILMYDVDGNFMSPPVRCPFSFDDFFVKTMNKKYGANYTMWAYMDDVKPKLEGNV